MNDLIKLKIDKYTTLALHFEFINMCGEKEYSVFEDCIISLPNRDIKIPRNTTTIHTKAEEIVYWHLLQQRTIIPLEASIIYYQLMKKLNIPFKKRLLKFIYSLRNMW